MTRRLLPFAVLYVLLSAGAVFLADRMGWALRFHLWETFCFPAYLTDVTAGIAMMCAAVVVVLALAAMLAARHAGGLRLVHLLPIAVAVLGYAATMAGEVWSVTAGRAFCAGDAAGPWDPPALADLLISAGRLTPLAIAGAALVSLWVVVSQRR